MSVFYVSTLAHSNVVHVQFMGMTHTYLRHEDNSSVEFFLLLDRKAGFGGYYTVASRNTLQSYDKMKLIFNVCVPEVLVTKCVYV